MEEEAKLISAEALEGQKLEFLIFLNSQIGKGAFGTVKKAIDNSKPYEELVAKIIPYGDEKSKEKINKQIEIIKLLPDHPNIVKVIPLKCFSEKNFYIFMEYCKDGTLEEEMIKKGRFSEQEAFNLFYQMMNGYRVLWQQKILHQDIKPDNILLKDGKYKLTDFGFSILHEGYKHTMTREGTFPYMPLEKLTRKEYYASTKSDVFAFGVIMFKVITGHHPYVISKYLDHKEYIRALRDNPLHLRSNLTSKFTIPMQHLFDMVLKMIAKNDGDRVDFPDIYEFIEEEQYFAKFHSKPEHNKGNDSPQKVISQEMQIEYKKFKITEQSNPVAIPFQFTKAQEQQYGSKIQEQIKDKERKELQQATKKLQKFLVARRLIVYFFDRLCRRLSVEKMKKEISADGIEEKMILCLLCLEKKVTQGSLKQYRYPSLFSQREWNYYKSTSPEIIKSLKNDESYIEDLIVEALSESHQIKIKEKRAIIEKAKEPLEVLMAEAKDLLWKLMESRKAMISLNERRSMTTLIYILSSIDITDSFSEWMERAEELETYFREVETQSLDALMGKLIHGFQKLGEDFTLDLGQMQEQSLSKNPIP